MENLIIFSSFHSNDFAGMQLDKYFFWFIGRS